MDFQNIVRSLERFGLMMPEVVRDVTLDDSRWKPADGAWSILEIVSHLADEEELDFRLRMSLVLANTDTPWPPVDPEGWAVKRRYNHGDLAAALHRFCSLRTESVAWLLSLDVPDWNQTYQHPQFGPFRAGDLLASWNAHDYLHLRQISKRMYQIAERNAGDYSIRYAGEWNAQPPS